MRYIYFSLFILLIIASCKNDPKQKEEEKSTDTSTKATNYFRISQPTAVDTLALGDSLAIVVQSRQEGVEIDSVQVHSKGLFLGRSSTNSFKIKATLPRVGEQGIEVKAFLSNGETQSKTIKQFFVSDLVPNEIKYTLVSKLKHNSLHYTQGLEIHEGALYESVGNYGKSGLYKKELRKLTELKEFKLAPNRFAEGITILNNRIYQLTYQAQEALIYDLASFHLVQKIPYPIQVQGWGLTNDGQNLIMSTGQPILYFLDPDYFNIKDQILICDNKGSVKMLNELEFVDDYVYANIWMKSIIAKIEISTGRVVGYLDLEELVPQHLKKSNDFVLNGIAYNHASQTYFVTGKRWDVMYEIKLQD